MTLVDDLRLPLDEREFHRRKFLSLLGAGALGTAMLGTGITAVRYLMPRAYLEEDARFVIGPPEDLAPGTVLVLLAHKVYVVRTDRGVFALSSVCTHLGCMTRYDPDDHRFACPCHGSRFQLSGQVLHGPAPRPLPRLEVTLERGQLVVNTARHVAPDTLLELGVMSRATRFLTENRFFRSVVRHGFPDSNRKRSLAVYFNFFLHIHPVKVRLRAIRFTRTFYLGGLSAGCFFILLVTGLLLMFYYRPAVPHAYQDMKDLEFVVAAGIFLRNLHRWTAHAMVGLVFLHMVLVFYRGAYRPPREFNWVIGVFLFLITILFSYTGYLLPWDQLAYWAVTVGTNMAQAVPVIGGDIKVLLLGGHDIGPNALLRFYVLHCAVLSAFFVLGLCLHIWRIRKDGGIYLPPDQDEK